MADVEPDLRAVARRLRGIILDVDPTTTEVVHLGERVATYGVGPFKMSQGYIYIHRYKDWSNLGFYRGETLSDPEGLLEGTGEETRHVKVAALVSVDDPAIRRLVEEAVWERRRAFETS
jgi:hypothetical protein